MYAQSKDRALERWGDECAQGPTRSQCGQCPGSVGEGEGNELREISRGRGWEMLWDVSFTPMGDVHPRRDSVIESFWAGITEALSKEGIIPGNIAPQAGSRCYWPSTTCLGHPQVTQPHPLPLLKSVSSQAHLVLYIRFLGTCVSESVGEVVPSADSHPSQPYWSASEDAWIFRKFPDPSKLEDSSPWIWGASVEPGPWSNCALFSLQAPTQGQAWNAQEREVWGASMQLRGHCRKSLHPTPCPRIQFRTLWELEGTGTLNSTPPLSSLLRLLIKAPFINAGNDFLSAKERYLSLMLHSLRVFYIPCSLNVICFFPLQLKCKPKR